MAFGGLDQLFGISQFFFWKRMMVSFYSVSGIEFRSTVLTVSVPLNDARELPS